VDPGPRLAWAALGFGLAALASSWNPAAAPFGLAVGLAAAVLAVRALRAGGRRLASALGLAAALTAVIISLVVLALTAGVGRGGEAALVSQPSQGEASRTLDEAAARSREARERARGELDRLVPSPRKTPSN
jgi:hypothetical protein